MMRLLRVEIDRFFSRRSTQVALVGLLGVVLVALFALYQSSRPATEAEVAQATQWYEDELVYWEENGEQILADCLADEAVARETDPNVSWGCEDQVPSLESYLQADSRLVYEAPGLLPAIGFATVFFGFVVGVSLVAAEFATGAMGSWLTFEPRRSRVFWSKTVAPGLGVVVPTIVASLLMVAGAWGIFAAWGAADGVTAEVWGEVAVSGLRVLLLTVGFAVLGAALAMILRSTAAAIGLAVGYFVVVEGFLVPMVSGAQGWSLFQSFQAVLRGAATYGVEECTTTSSGVSCTWVERTTSLTHGAVELSVLLAVVLVVALVTFRQRDVA